MGARFALRKSGPDRQGSGVGEGLAIEAVPLCSGKAATCLIQSQQRILADIIKKQPIAYDLPAFFGPRLT